MNGILRKKPTVEKVIYFFDFDTTISIKFFLLREMVHCTKLGKPISLLLRSRLGTCLPQHKLLQGYLIPWIQIKI
jgi:hypothetical protein